MGSVRTILAMAASALNSVFPVVHSADPHESSVIHTLHRLPNSRSSDRASQPA